MKDKIYFASDFHLGALSLPDSKKREKIIVSWLKEIKKDAAKLFLVGDLFDYWFEYKEVVPKGYIRFFGALADLADEGVEIHFFKGNHDMWVFDYFQSELGIIVHDDLEVFKINDKKILVGHGDGLGAGDNKYKFIKAILRSKLCQWLFSMIHPNIGMGLMKYFSNKSRMADGDNSIKDIKSERQIQYCEQQLLTEHYDIFIFGHRHIPFEYLLSNGSSIYYNLGEWWDAFSYLVIDGNEIELKNYKFNR